MGKDQTHLRHFIRFWLPVYICAGIIFIASSLSHPPKAPLFPHADKLIHLVEYAILGYLLARAAKHSAGLKLSVHFRTFAVCVAILYGISDEFHQFFVPGRAAEVLDLVADGLGAFFGQYLLKG